METETGSFYRASGIPCGFRITQDGVLAYRKVFEHPYEGSEIVAVLKVPNEDGRRARGIERAQ